MARRKGELTSSKIKYYVAPTAEALLSSANSMAIHGLMKESGALMRRDYRVFCFRTLFERIASSSVRQTMPARQGFSTMVT
jgi:hypothetical protein